MAVSNLVTASAGVFPTWTQLGFTNPSTLTTCTFSNLGGYKYIKVLGIIFNSQTGATNLRVRINGDSTAGMYVNSGVQYSGSNGAVAVRTSGPTTGFDLGAYGTNIENHIELEFINPTQTDGKKIVNYNFPGYDGASYRHNVGTGIYNSNSAITSISLSSTNNYAFEAGNTTITGFYVYGAN